MDLPDPMEDERFRDFLAVVAARLEIDAASGDTVGSELATFAALLRTVSGPVRRVQREHPPGLRHLDAMLAETRTGRYADLAGVLAPILNHAHWTRFYTEVDWTRPFLDEFANGELIGPSGAVYSAQVILGAFVLGPNTLYPPHAHPAVEIYLPLAGWAEFAVGGAGFRAVVPGAYSLHPSNAQHAVRTRDRPLLALFAWRGDLLAPSWYLDAHGRRQVPPKLASTD